MNKSIDKITIEALEYAIKHLEYYLDMISFMYDKDHEEWAEEKRIEKFIEIEDYKIKIASLKTLKGDLDE